MPLDATPRGFHTLRVNGLRRETDDAISLAFDVPADLRSQFAWKPGQYLTLRTTLDGEEVRRSYSICSGPDDGELRVAIKLVEGGQFSAWAHTALTTGHAIDVMPPEGRFTLPPGPDGRTVLAIAAGSGITPVLSIVKAVLTREPDSRVVLLYGSRATAAILFREELEALKDRFMTRLSVVHVLSREQQDIATLNGRLDGAKVAALLPGLVPGGLPDVALLCGPAGMIEAVSAALVAAGMPPERVRSERFVAAGGPVPRRASSSRVVDVVREAPFATAAIVSDGVRTEVPVRADETVLEAALGAGLDLPYSCRAGMCSTCRARVTEGAVRMDVNYGLEPWETDAGYVLTCQARPTTPYVVVDYDHV